MPVVFIGVLFNTCVVKLILFNLIKLALCSFDICSWLALISSPSLSKCVGTDVDPDIGVGSYVSTVGYEPADLTVHPPPRMIEGGCIFFA